MTIFGFMDRHWFLAFFIILFTAQIIVFALKLTYRVVVLANVRRGCGVDGKGRQEQEGTSR